MRILVTGCAGFIGSHLTESLLNGGIEVVGVDNLVNGRIANLELAEKHPLFSFHCGDIVSREFLEEIPGSFDAIVHLAALADIVPSIEHPEDYMRNNVGGTWSVLEFARSRNVADFVYAASASCYGEQPDVPTSEKGQIVPAYPYALSKALGEDIVLNWGRYYRFRTVSLRLFNVYGTRARTSSSYGAVIGVFMAQLLAGQSLTVVGDGTQSRDFVHVYDVCDAFRRVLSDRAVSGVFNVATGIPIQVNRLAELIGGNVVNIPERPGEPRETIGDATKLREATGWKPKVSIEAGISEILANKDYWQGAPIWTPESIERATENWFQFLGSGTSGRHTQ